jgi:hypothetical protein
MQKGPLGSVPKTERDAVGALLNSHLLARSPKILKLAEYIGRKYLEGEAEMLKEYNIAVEALGKPAEFDPKHDSIVRVEAHRLRRKLSEYYATEGAADPFRMVLDPGNYIPRFLPNGLHRLEPDPPPKLPEALADSPQPPPDLLPQEAPAPDALAPAPIPPAPAVPRPKSRRFSLPLWVSVAAASAIVIAATAATAISRRPSPLAPVEIRFLAGATVGPLQGPWGEAWSPDTWSHGGITVSGPNAAAITETAGIPMNIQKQGDFDYEIPLSAPVYELRLYFGPRITPDGSALDPLSTRRFDVLANGHKILDALDPSAVRPHAGWSTRVFRDIAAAPDGKLHLSFRSGLDPAYLNAIQLTPGERGRMLPIRIVANTTPYREPNGRIWGADRYVTGGKLAVRSERVKNALDPNLYSGERFGTFTYKIPLAKGQYGVRLYLAETWFGPTFGGGIGSRRFDVYANGVPLLQDFDLFRTAGGSYRAITRDFHGLSPQADGYLDLTFVPRVNHACINALEVYDESR